MVCRAAILALDVARGVAYLHSQRVIHMVNSPPPFQHSIFFIVLFLKIHSRAFVFVLPQAEADHLHFFA